jgi:hypothetical protein
LNAFCPIVQQYNRFCSSYDSSLSLKVQQLFNRGESKIMTIRAFVSGANRRQRLRPNSLSCIYCRPKLAIPDDPAFLRIHSGRQGSSIDFRRADIDRMMVLEEDTLLGKLKQRRTVLLPYKIRAHTVPHNHDHMRGSPFR